jgi:hypothetical protein
VLLTPENCFWKNKSFLDEQLVRLKDAEESCLKQKTEIHAKPIGTVR